MVKKIDGSFFLNRKEAIDYLMKAYELKWCITTWQKGKIKVSYETKQSARKYFITNAYKVRSSEIIQFAQKDLDAGMMY